MHPLQVIGNQSIQELHNSGNTSFNCSKDVLHISQKGNYICGISFSAINSITQNECVIEITCKGATVSLWRNVKEWHIGIF